MDKYEKQRFIRELRGRIKHIAGNKQELVLDAGMPD